MEGAIGHWFDENDDNGSEGLTRFELRRALFREVDRDGDHQLSLDEAHALIIGVAGSLERDLNPGWQEEFDEGFSGIDEDESDTVSLVELEKALAEFRAETEVKNSMLLLKHYVMSISTP